MSSQSTNLSKRLFFTVSYIDGSARIGTIKSPQKDLVELTNEELINLINFLINHKVLEDITPDLSEDN